MEFIANTGYSLQATPESSGVPGTVSGIPIVGTTMIDGSPNIGISLPFIASSCSMPSCTFTSGGGAISATSVCLVDGTPVLRKGDSGACVGSFMSNSSPPVAIPCKCSVEISDAGQTSVQCD